MIRILLGSIAALVMTAGTVLANSHTVRVGQIDATSFPTVDVYVSVTDASGQFISGLGAAEFRLWEDGTAVRPEQVTAAEELTVILVIDRSGSMADGGKMEAAKRAALAYIDALRPRDRVALIDFDLSPSTGRGLDEDRATVAARIAGLRAGGGTGLFDATYTALEILRTVKGRKAALVLTDGMDGGKGRRLQQVLEVAVKDATSIFTIGLGARSLLPGLPGDIDEDVLETMARSTNGEYLHAPGPDQLAALYQRISRRLSSEYLVRYQSPRPIKDGTRRSVEVSVVVGGTEQNAASAYLITGVLGAGATNWPLFVLLLLVLLALLHPGGLPALIEGRPLGVGLGLKPRPVATAAAAGGGVAAPPAMTEASRVPSPSTHAHEVARVPAPTSASANAARSTSSPPRPAQLVDATGRIHSISRASNTLGRSGCDIAFVDSTVAPTQARIDFVGDRFVLVDLAGNTRVNGGAPPPGGSALNSGDEITFGRRQLIFRA